MWGTTTRMNVHLAWEIQVHDAHIPRIHIWSPFTRNCRASPSLTLPVYTSFPRYFVSNVSLYTLPLASNLVCYHAHIPSRTLSNPMIIELRWFPSAFITSIHLVLLNTCSLSHTRFSSDTDGAIYEINESRMGFMGFGDWFQYNQWD